MLFYNEFLRCFLKVALSLKKKGLEFQYLFFYGDIFFSEINMTELALLWNVTYLIWLQGLLGI